MKMWLKDSSGSIDGQWLSMLCFYLCMRPIVVNKSYSVFPSRIGMPYDCKTQVLIKMGYRRHFYHIRWLRNTIAFILWSNSFSTSCWITEIHIQLFCFSSSHKLKRKVFTWQVLYEFRKTCVHVQTFEKNFKTNTNSWNVRFHFFFQHGTLVADVHTCESYTYIYI